MIPIVVGALGMVSKSIEKTGGNGNQRKNWDHPNHSIPKSTGDPRRLVVTQILVKDSRNELKIIVHKNYHPRDVMVIVVGNGHSDTSSNPGRDWLHFT